MVKSRKARCTGHVACIGEMNACRVSVECNKEKDDYEDQDTEE
jgi:hypothetical protein